MLNYSPNLVRPLHVGSAVVQGLPSSNRARPRRDGCEVWRRKARARMARAASLFPMREPPDRYGGYWRAPVGGTRDAEIEDFLEGFNQPTYRGMRVNGQAGRYLVIPRWMVRGQAA